MQHIVAKYMCLPYRRRGVNPGGGGTDREEDPVQAERILALQKTIEPIIENIGLHPDDPAFLPRVTRKTIEFFETLFEEQYIGEEWQQLAARREVFRVLPYSYRQKIQDAYDKNNTDKERRVETHITQELTFSSAKPYGKKQQRLDPACWELRPYPGAEYGTYLHLAKLAEVVRVQNQKAVANARMGREPLDGGKLRPEEQEAFADLLRSAVAETHQLPGSGQQGRGEGGGRVV